MRLSTSENENLRETTMNQKRYRQIKLLLHTIRLRPKPALMQPWNTAYSKIQTLPCDYKQIRLTANFDRRISAADCSHM